MEASNIQSNASTNLIHFEKKRAKSVLELPLEVLAIILAKTPLTDVLNSRLACKRFNSCFKYWVPVRLEEKLFHGTILCAQNGEVNYELINMVDGTIQIDQRMWTILTRNSIVSTIYIKHATVFDHVSVINSMGKRKTFSVTIEAVSVSKKVINCISELSPDIVLYLDGWMNTGMDKEPISSLSLEKKIDGLWSISTAFTTFLKFLHIRLEYVYVVEKCLQDIMNIVCDFGSYQKWVFEYQDPPTDENKECLEVETFVLKLQSHFNVDIEYLIDRPEGSNCHQLVMEIAKIGESDPEEQEDNSFFQPIPLLF